MKRIFIAAFLIFLTACQQRETETQDDGRDSLDLSEPLQAEPDRQVTLLPEAREAVSEWLAYATAQNEIEAIKNATGREIVQNSEPLVQIMENLQATLPPRLQESAVRARVNVLVTKANILHQSGHKKYRNQEEIYEAAGDLVEEFQNFKLQLNELFLSTPEDFELELENLPEETEQDTLAAPPAPNEFPAQD